MPVVYLPQDTRWGDLGKGLGQMLGAVAGNVWDQHVSSDVANMQQSPELKDNPNKLLQTVSQKYGAAGIKSLNTLLDSQAKVAQLDLTGQESRLDKARAGLSELELAIKSEAKPEEIAQIKANLAHTISQTQLAQAETAFTAGPRTAATTASTAETEARIPGTKATSQITTQEAARGYGETKARTAETEEAILQAQLTGFNNLSGPDDPNDPKGPTRLQRILKDAGVTKPEDVTAVSTAVEAAGPKGAGAALRAELDKIRARDAQKVIPSQYSNKLDNIVATLPDLDPFLQPGSGKGFWGGVAAWFAKKGITSDPELARDLTAGEQNMGHFADSGTGFGGAWRVKLGADVTPQVQHSTLSNVLSVGQIAQATLARLSNMERELSSVPGQEHNVQLIKEYETQWQQRLDQSNTLWWASDKLDKNGQGDTSNVRNMHFYYQGQEVDRNLRPIGTSTLAKSGQTYFLKGGKSTGYTADEINDAARHLGVTPDTYLKNMEVPR